MRSLSLCFFFLADSWIGLDGFGIGWLWVLFYINFCLNATKWVSLS